jgi:hypothetical protein
MQTELTVIKKNKRYNNRRLIIYEGEKIINEVSPFFGWYCWKHNITPDMHKKARVLIMENLYWLLGKDCSFEEWQYSINHWNEGKGISGVSSNFQSVFFNDEEKDIALNSFHKN